MNCSSTSYQQPFQVVGRKTRFMVVSQAPAISIPDQFLAILPDITIRARHAVTAVVDAQKYKRNFDVL